MESKEGGLKKGFWKPEEDLILKKYVESNGEGNWSVVSKKSGKYIILKLDGYGGGVDKVLIVGAGLMRGAKSCRLRWKNYLRPNIKRGIMSQDEKDLIIRLHKLLGNRWSLIAGRLPGRTDNEVKNYWNTHLNKRPSRAQIKETPVEEDSLATATTEAAAGTKPQGENIDTTSSGAICWIEDLKDGDFYGMTMHPDYGAYNYMPIFDDLVYSTSFECAGAATATSTEEAIFNFCSLIN